MTLIFLIQGVNELIMFSKIRGNTMSIKKLPLLEKINLDLLTIPFFNKDRSSKKK